jgi:transposase
MRPAEQDRADLQLERAAFLAWMGTVDPTRVKVIDESGLVRGLRLGYGYAPKGHRVYDCAPLKRGKRLNMVGWMGFDGSGAVATHPGTVTGPIFRGFVHRHLLPALREGDLVIWDNHRIHQVEGLKEKIAARGAVLKPLPRYSPDLNPIELLWSKLKHSIKKARADTEEALEQAVEAAVGLVCRADARGWFEHCGFCLQSE